MLTLMIKAILYCVGHADQCPLEFHKIKKGNASIIIKLDRNLKKKPVADHDAVDFSCSLHSRIV